MRPIPLPSRPDERVFGSCYRFDRRRKFIINFLLPAAALLAIIGIPFFCWRMYGLIAPATLPHLKNQALTLLVVLGMTGLGAGGGFLLLCLVLRRMFFNTFIYLN